MLKVTGVTELEVELDEMVKTLDGQGSYGVSK